jgi:hypothetical protein
MKFLLFAALLGLAMNSFAQTNNFNPNGNVGIGIYNPQSLLHIANGDVLLQNTTTGYPSLWAKNVNGSQTLRLDYNSLRIEGGDGYIRTTGTFILNDIGGNVAIGTNNAQGYKLAVNGIAIFEGVKVKLITNWPDYVFQRDYQLMPIAELERFLQQNKHLPGIPSAAEVEKEGLDLGSNQAALLKKIEELTLYIIEQNKEIQQIKAKLLEQERKAQGPVQSKK